MIPTEIQEYTDDVQFQIGQRIQKKRLEKHLSAADVASYLDVKPNQISRIENGRSSCTVQQLFVLTQLLECSADYLLSGMNGKRVLSLQEEMALNYFIQTFKNTVA